VPPPELPADFTQTFDRIANLLAFPAQFPLKVMGLRVDDFAQQLVDVVQTHLPQFDLASVEMRSSSTGKYLSLTLNLQVANREELEAVYRAVSTHPLVKVVL
jgi:uncharacterized protein